MNAKTIVTVVLFLFVTTSIVYLLVGGSHSPSAPAPLGPPTTAVQTPPEPGGGKPAEAPEKSAEAATTVVAYYFHRTQRCRTCLLMEAYAEQALMEAFPDAFASGGLQWRAVNVEEPENEHFVQDYGLTASALVVVHFENDEVKEWKNLEQVWSLVGDEGEFKEYVRREVQGYLER